MKRELPRGIFERDGELWIRYSDNAGRIHREKIGTSLKLAKDAYRKRKTEIREGRFFPEKLRERPVAFPELAADFLSHSQKTKRDHAHDRSRIETLLRLWRDCLLNELTPGRIERDLSECAGEEEWKPATYNRYRAVCSAIFSLAIRNSKAVVNPIRGTKHRIENNTRVRYLSSEEEARLFYYIDQNSPERKTEILVALHSGMRRSEQYATRHCSDGGLKWSHIDFASGVITLPRSKHGESRHIPMNSALRNTLAKLKEAQHSPYVFPFDPPDEWFPKACRHARNIHVRQGILNLVSRR